MTQTIEFMTLARQATVILTAKMSQPLIPARVTTLEPTTLTRKKIMEMNAGTTTYASSTPICKKKVKLDPSL